MDLVTGLAIFTALAGSEVLKPTNKAIGEKLKESLEKIALKAKAKFNSEQLADNIQPNYRVIKAISNEGAFCDDELMAEYFGGVLASSLSEVSRDDRGVSFASLVGRLTTYQIRAHYIFYNTVKALFDGRTDVSVLSSKYRNKLEVFYPNDSFNLAMEFSEKENVSVILPSVMSGLARESLIEKDYEVIGGEKTAFCGGNGIVFCPTDLGTELFLWVHGKNNIPVKDFLKPEHKFSVELNVKLPRDYKSVEKVLKYHKDLKERIKPEF
jgi:hypothetical protein